MVFRRNFVFEVLAAVLVIGLLPGFSMAQDAPVDEVVAPVPAEYASARATMQTFLEAFYAEAGADLDLAASCIDLSGLSANLRATKGHEAAADLKNVIDRTRYVEIDKISDLGEGSPYVFLRQTEGEVVIERVEDGRWLFSKQTLADVDALRRATSTEDVVEGVEEFKALVSPAMWLRSKAPQTLRSGIFFLEGWQWIGLVFVIILGVILDRLFIAISTGAVSRMLRKRFAVIDAELLNRALKPAGALVMVLVWWAGIGVLGLPVKVLTLYSDAVWIVLILAACATAYRLVSLIADAAQKRAQATESKADDLLVPLIRKAAKVLIVTIGIVLIADSLHQNLTGLLAGLGLGGLAFALAAQDTVSNLFGSLTVLLDRPFHVGDWVVVGGVEGTVEEVGFRSTRIRTFYDSLITLPNSNLTNASVDNYGNRTYRRWSTKLGIAYNTPPEKVDAFCEGVRELIRRHPNTRKDYFHVYLNSFGDSALEIMLYVFFKTPDWGKELEARHSFAVDLLRLAAEMGVEFAYPTQTLYMRQEPWQSPEVDVNTYLGESARLSDDARKTVHGMTEHFHGE